MQDLGVDQARAVNKRSNSYINQRQDNHCVGRIPASDIVKNPSSLLWSHSE